MKKHIPNTITLFNLISGCIAIIMVFSGDAWIAGWFIIIAAVLDFVDGFMARLLNAKSELGNMLDSLADVVSFGVAPGMIAFLQIKYSEQIFYGDYPELIAYIALLMPAMAALRLAKFSIDNTQTETFRGLPSPANGLFIAALPILLRNHYDIQVVNLLLSNTIPLVIIVVVFSLLMVAPFRMMSLKFKNFKIKENSNRYLLLVISLPLLIIANAASIPVIILIYILISFFTVKYSNH